MFKTLNSSVRLFFAVLITCCLPPSSSSGSPPATIAPDRFRRFSKVGGFSSCYSAFFCPAVAAHPVATAHVQAELIGETTAIQPGQPFWVALRLNAKWTRILR
ncbi:MAG: hypothetical protein R3F40_07065 [Candidatus Competibacteraceae bacterium]